MAKPEAAETPVSAPVPVPARRSSKLLLIILLAMVLILIIVVAVFVVLVVSKKNTGGNASASQHAIPLPVVSAPVARIPTVDISKPPIFVQLEPFTVNLRAKEGEDSHYLQTDIALRVNDSKTADALKGWMPEIRNRVNLILSSKSISDVQGDLSHENVQSEILRGLNAMFGIPPPPPEVPQAHGSLGPIQGVLFISFIVQ